MTYKGLSFYEEYVKMITQKTEVPIMKKLIQRNCLPKKRQWIYMHLLVELKFFQLQ